MTHSTILAFLLLLHTFLWHEKGLNILRSLPLCFWHSQSDEDGAAQRHSSVYEVHARVVDHV